jgi:hypothetical protein
MEPDMSFSEFLQKAAKGEASPYEVDIEAKTEELLESLLSFIPEGPVEESWDSAMVQYMGFKHLMDYMQPNVGALLALTMEMRAVVTTAYWLGRRDERLEGMLGGVEMKGERE